MWFYRSVWLEWLGTVHPSQSSLHSWDAHARGHPNTRGSGGILKYGSDLSLNHKGSSILGIQVNLRQLSSISACTKKKKITTGSSQGDFLCSFWWTFSYQAPISRKGRSVTCPYKLLSKPCPPRWNSKSDWRPGRQNTLSCGVHMFPLKTATQQTEAHTAHSPEDESKRLLRQDRKGSYLVNSSITVKLVQQRTCSCITRALKIHKARKLLSWQIGKIISAPYKVGSDSTLSPGRVMIAIWSMISSSRYY